MRNVDQISITNLITQLFNIAKISVFQHGGDFSTVPSNNGLYIVLSVEKNH